MIRFSRCKYLLPVSAALLFGPLLSAQEAPAVLSVFCNTIKPGAFGDMIRNETAWARAYERDKEIPMTIGLTSVTGPPSACWMMGHESVAAYGQVMQRSGAIDARFEAGSARYALTGRGHIARLRPDLSYGTPDVLQKQAMMWLTIRGPAGSSEVVAAAMKAFAAARTRAGLQNDWRVYQVMQGAPAETWWVLSSVKDLATFDQNFADDPKIGAVMTADDQKIFEAYFARITLSSADLWMYNPLISSIPAADRKANPGWALPVQAAAKKP
jgi:hypothetical protein